MEHFHGQVRLASTLNSNLVRASFNNFFPSFPEAAIETSDAGPGFQVMARCLILSGLSFVSFGGQPPAQK